MSTESNIIKTGRRSFLKNLTVGAAGLSLGSLGMAGCASNSGGIVTHRRSVGAPKGNSKVTFVTSTDHREAAFQALKPIQSQIENEIGDKQVIIKVNMGQVAENVWLNATDANFTRGILDFLAQFYDREVIVAESTAAGSQSTLVGMNNYGFMPLEKEYNAVCKDLNDDTFTKRFIRSNKQHPLGINVLDSFIDPNFYVISATRLKTHNCVVATLSLKNVAMAAPVNHYKQQARLNRNEKPLMHEGGNRGLSYNIFRLATLGVQPDLAVLDGVVGMEGNGPVNGTPVEQGVAVASTDWLAADRFGCELMGVDYNECKYLHWCKDAGMGQDDLSQISVIGPDYKSHIVKYKLHDNIQQQREWINEDYEA